MKMLLPLVWTEREETDILIHHWVYEGKLNTPRTNNLINQIVLGHIRIKDTSYLAYNAFVDDKGEKTSYVKFTSLEEAKTWVEAQVEQNLADRGLLYVP